MMTLSYIRHVLVVLILPVIVMMTLYPTNNHNTIMVYSWPDGAGACTGGKAAVDGSHRDTDDGTKKVRFVTFQQKQVAVLFGDNPFTTNSSVSNFTIPYNTIINKISVIARKSKGILIRIVPKNWPILIEATNNVIIADVCTLPVYGLTHENNNLKNRYDGQIIKNDNDNDNNDNNVPHPKAVIFVDITIVYSNNDSISSYTYKRFTLYPKV